MERKQRIEITDLLEQAVENAVARRNEALHLEDTLPTLSDDEAANIVGGSTLVAQPISVYTPPKRPVKPPITVGIIATNPPVA
ncbi:hypothetical protein [Nostoc sp. MG11]|uniref:hypothetical protein n=1 Tax=Nostoc sp. MG11 TaxID=2721166 RepID=UPI0018677286|nr:hypothetical protein [Nostoc sp. MG11]